jgi:peptide/nickel transport system substrate-binding protein
MKKVLFLLLALTLVLSACGTPAPAAEAPAAEAPAAEAPVAEAPATEAAPAEAAVVEQAPVVIGMDSILDQMDPMFSSSINAASIYENMFDEMVVLDENVELVPSVAKEWTTSEDGKTWTFTLRDDVKFWDGTPLTAADVKYTIDRMTDPAIGATGNTEYLVSQMLVEKVEVIDDYTVAITTQQPVPAFLYSLQEVTLLSKAFYENLSVDESAKTAMGSGPFKFVEFVLDDHISMVANEDYWGGAPAIKELVFRNIPEASTRIAELSTGGADVAQNIPVAKFSEVEAIDTARLVSKMGGCRMFFGFNFADPTYQDKNVRQAMNYAVDWDTINDVIFGGAAPRMVVNVNPPWLNESLSAYTYDPDKAKELLAASGYTPNADGMMEKDGVVLSPEIMIYYDPTSDRYEVLTSIIDMYQQIGINASAIPTERSVAIDKLINKDFGDMFFMGSCSSFEGQGDITDLATTSVTNYGGWDSPEFMDLYNKLLVEFDPAVRAQLLDDMQVIVFEEAPQVFLYRLINSYGIANRIDWDPPITGRIHMFNVKFVE